MAEARSAWRTAILVAACLGVAAVVLASPVRYAGADPQGTFLVAEQLLTKGTVTLDDLGPTWTEGNYRAVEIGDHHYYYFPPGAPLTVLPVVAVAVAAGVDIATHDTGLQIFVSAALAALTVLLLFAVARFFLGFRPSILLALGFWAATPLASTNGTALWSHGPAVAYALIAVIAALHATERRRLWCWVPLAITLCMAILSRPTMAVFALGLLAFVVSRHRRTGISAAVLLAGLLVAFAAGHWVLAGLLIPPYYQPGRLSDGDLLTGLLGVLASPSRGLLFYMPWVVLLGITAWLTRRQWSRWRFLVGANVAVIVTLVLAVSTFALWYGGAGYGPRLLTDALPSLYVVLVAVWPHAWPVRWVPLAVGWGLIALLSVGQHTLAGLFNPATLRWNAAGTHDLSLFVNDWRYPQFLHTDARQAERQATYDTEPPSGVGYLDVPRPWHGAVIRR